MGLVTQEVRRKADTLALVIELQAQLMDVQDLAREVARRLERTPPTRPSNVLAFKKAA